MPRARPPEAALGRQTRGLVGRDRGRRSLPGLPFVGPRRGAAVPRSAAGRGRRLPSFRRIVTPGRAGGLLGMLAAGFLLTFVTGPTAFALGRIELPVLAWTDRETLTAALGLEPGANPFRLDTVPLEAALEALPAVADADVRVTLPDGNVVVAVDEREAILAWEAGETRYLADPEGVIFAAVATGARLPAGVTVVQDRRLDAAGRFAIGDRLDPVDLDVATRLGSLQPTDVGSLATGLHVRVTESDGFVVYVDRGWSAVFGYYSPAMRPTDMIPGQVRLLRSLLYGREGTLERIILASDTDGTYVPKATPKPTRNP